MTPGHEPTQRVLDHADPNLPPIEPTMSSDLQQVTQGVADAINTEAGWSLLIEVGGNVVVALLESIGS